MKLYYEEYGQGETYILLHGHLENRKSYYPLIKKYPSIHFIVIDLTNHGKSYKVKQVDYTLLVKDVKETIDDLKLTNYHLIGFDIGANIIMKLLQIDKNIQSACLLSPYLNKQDIKWTHRFFMYMQYILYIPFSLYLNKAKRLKNNLKLALMHAKIDLNKNKEVKIPIFIIYGENDYIKEKTRKEIASSYPYSIMKTIDKCNHYVLDESEKTMLYIRGYINE